VNDLRTKMDDLQGQTFKHAKTVNDTLTKEIIRMEKVAGALENHTTTSLTEVREVIRTLDEKFE
jgi:hypothetical protein